MSEDELRALIRRVINDVMTRPPRRALVVFTGALLGFDEAIESLRELVAAEVQLEYVKSPSARHILDARVLTSVGMRHLGDDPIADHDMLILPTLTSNTAAKIAHGIADDMVSNLAMNFLQTPGRWWPHDRRSARMDPRNSGTPTSPPATRKCYGRTCKHWSRSGSTSSTRLSYAVLRLPPSKRASAEHRRSPHSFDIANTPGRIVTSTRAIPLGVFIERTSHYVPSSDLQSLRQDHLGGVRPAHRPGQSIRACRPVVRRETLRRRGRGGQAEPGWLLQPTLRALNQPGLRTPTPDHQLRSGLVRP